MPLPSVLIRYAEVIWDEVCVGCNDLQTLDQLKNLDPEDIQWRPDEKGRHVLSVFLFTFVCLVQTCGLYPGAPKAFLKAVFKKIALEERVAKRARMSSDGPQDFGTNEKCQNLTMAQMAAMTATAMQQQKKESVESIDMEGEMGRINLIHAFPMTEWPQTNAVSHPS